MSVEAAETELLNVPLSAAAKLRMYAEVADATASLARQIKSQSERLLEMPRDYAVCYGIVQVLEDAGFFGARVAYRGQGVTIRVERQRLTAMRHVVGRLSLDYRGVIGPESARLMRVVLKAELHPKLSVEYTCPLPAADRPNAKCKLVTHTSTYTTLVCAND